MSYPKNTAKIRPAGGLVLDLPPNAVSENFWTAGRNVLFRNGFAARVPGSRVAYPVDTGSLPEAAYHALNLQAQGLNFWLSIGVDTVHAIEGSSFDDITPVGGLTAVSTAEDWSSDLLNGVPIINNGREPPLFWDGVVSNPMTTLTGWPEATIARSIAVLKYHIFAFDIDGPDGDNGSLVMWSDQAEPGTIPSSWTPAANNDAGSAPCSDTPGRIMCGKKLRGSMAIYKPSGIYLANYLGPSSDFNQEVFAIDLKFASVGAWTRRAVADCDGYHLVVSDGDIVRVDPSNVVSAADARVRNFLQNNIDPDNYRKLFVVRDPAKREVWVCFPEKDSTECSLALVWDQRKDTWGIRDLPQVKHAANGLVSDTSPSEAWDDDSQVWDEDQSVWNTSAGVSTQSRLVTVYDSTMRVHDTDDNVTLTAMVAKYDMDLGFPERSKFIRGVKLGMSRFGNVSARIGYRNSLDDEDPIQWSTSQVLTSPNSQLDRTIEGKYISIEITTTDDKVWELSYLGFEVEPRGYV